MIERFPLIEVSGTHFEVGVNVGTTMHKQIQAGICELKNHENYKSTIGKLRPLFEYTRINFPKLIEEIDGISHGAGVDLMDFFYANCSEIDSNYSDHCTVVVSKSKKEILVGHNEDWSKEAEDELYLLRANIDGNKIFSLNYAVGVFGIATAINGFGLIQSINSVDSLIGLGVPRNFVARAVLETKTIDDSVHLLTSTKNASGFNHVLAQGDRVINVEISATNVTVDNITEPTFVHTNHYLSHIQHKEKISNSSIFRLIRAKELIKPGMKINEIKRLLSDNENKSYPINRPSETIASIIFEPAKGKVHICRGNPSKSGYLAYSFQI